MDTLDHLISETNKKTIKALPALEEISNTATLWEYFAKKVSPILIMREKNYENKLLSKIIIEEINKLYGDKTAEKAEQQLRRLPVLETGTHLAFMRDHDTQSKDSLRSHLHQNVIISSALMKRVGASLHIGVYASNVSLSSSCSAGYFQLGDEIFPVTTNKNINSYMLYNAPRMTESFFNESILEIARYSALRDILKEEEQNSPNLSALKILNNILASVDNNKMNYEGFKNTISKMNSDKKEALDTAMLALNHKLKEKKGYGFEDINKQFIELKKVFDRNDLSFAEQVALIQSQEINAITLDSGIEHVSLDSMMITKKFLIESLKDKNTLWYNIFNNKELFEKFHKSFVGIRSSWKEEESPFDNLRNEKGFFKSRSLHKDALTYKPDEIIELLEKNQIVPSNSLMTLVYQSADMLIHGGFFQSTYAQKIKESFVEFLNENNLFSREKNLEKIPADMMLLSLVSVEKDKIPLKLSEIARMGKDERNILINNIPASGSNISVEKGLDFVTKYLNKIAPGYIEQEACNNTTQPVVDIKDILIRTIVQDNCKSMAI